MNSDFKDLLRIFGEEEVDYLIVGAYAVIHYTQPRYTKDIGLWIRPSVENAARIARAFHRFGLPLIEVTQEDFEHEGLQYVVGVSPCQINFLTSLPGTPSFEDSWKHRAMAEEDGIHPLPRKVRPHHCQAGRRASAGFGRPRRAPAGRFIAGIGRPNPGPGQSPMSEIHARRSS